MSLPNEGVWLGKIEIKFLKLMYHPYPLKLKFAVTNKMKCFLPLDLKVLNFSYSMLIMIMSSRCKVQIQLEFLKCALVNLASSKDPVSFLKYLLPTPSIVHLQ